jgi:archaellum component FlaC
MSAGQETIEDRSRRIKVVAKNYDEWNAEIEKFRDEECPGESSVLPQRPEQIEEVSVKRRMVMKKIERLENKNEAAWKEMTVRVALVRQILKIRAIYNRVKENASRQPVY